VGGPETEEAADLAGLLAVRIADLTGYHDEGYARQYADFVERVRVAEAAAVPGETAVTEAVARSLHKLMAYKDEYEVARLALDPAFEAHVTEAFGPGSQVSYRLHPPVLRALGLEHKVTLGPWFKPAFQVLRSSRRLRGTPADVFGYSRMRRLERQLIADYRASVERALGRLSPGTHETVTRIAALPDVIRGYEQVKLGNVVRYRRELTALRAELDRPASLVGQEAGAGPSSG
jgi:indolepyruvate ferredoxin oxidoreductase